MLEIFGGVLGLPGIITGGWGDFGGWFLWRIHQRWLGIKIEISACAGCIIEANERSPSVVKFLPSYVSFRMTIIEREWPGVTPLV